ncbi:MAG: hypothetical protein V1647_05915 [Pseudomonadota bacterium]
MNIIRFLIIFGLIFCALSVNAMKDRCGYNKDDAYREVTVKPFGQDVFNKTTCPMTITFSDDTAIARLIGVNAKNNLCTYFYSDFITVTCPIK